MTIAVASADTVILAHVQAFGTTPALDPQAYEIRNVQIDWVFSEDHEEIKACRLIFDKPVTEVMDVICRVSGPDNTTSDIFDAGTFIGSGTAIIHGGRLVEVPLKCDPDGDNAFDHPCGINDVSGVQVVLVERSQEEISQA